ncbi:MAG TPA: hypothetical protein VIP46_06495 [Pyrinomonadaceae bacterium]
MTIQDFERLLREALAAELEDWRPRLSPHTMRAFDLGCHPWHGYIEPSFLTLEEGGLVHGEAIWRGVGEWRLYNFLAPGSGWARVSDLERWMQDRWTRAADHAAAAEDFLRAFASVAMSAEVVRALQSYKLSSDFQIGVIDTDDPKLRNFCDDWKEVVRRHGGA